MDWANIFKIATGTLISEDLTLVAALYSYKIQIISASTLLIGYLSGVTIGDYLLYLVGYFSRHIKYLWIQKKIATAKVWTTNNTEKFDTFLILTRFIPGSRIPTYFLAGATKYPALKFLSLLMFSTFIFAIVNLAVINIFKSQISSNSWLQNLVLAAVSFLVTIVLFKTLIFVYKNRGDIPSALKAKWYSIARLKHPEFWPPSIFYAPTYLVYIFLCIKNKLMFTPSYANPSIPYSGIVGESKSLIDKLLLKAAPSQHLKTLVLSKTLSPEKKLEETINFKDSYNLNYPIVCKPNKGERGKDVYIAENKNDLLNYFKSSSKEVLLQEFCDYQNELGILYYNLNNSHEVLSVTKKVFPSVIGDGQKTLQQLVLSDSRAKFLSSVYQKHNQELWHKVIPKGQEHTLTQIGNHSQGCIFLDGSDLLSQKLKDAVISISKNIPEFHFGRFDIKYKSEEELNKGHFKIIELNGAMAEATHIYDPKMKLKGIYSVLFKQLRIVFKIGRQNYIRLKLKESSWAFLPVLFFPKFYEK